MTGDGDGGGAIGPRKGVDEREARVSAERSDGRPATITVPGTCVSAGAELSLAKTGIELL